MDNTTVEILENASVRVTPNRILVLKELLEASSPMSLIELETTLETLDRSSILRALTALSKHGVIHSVEDGRGVVKYEICHGHDDCSADDMHAHFYCEKCERVFCFEDIEAPRIKVPQGFQVRSINYMLKGICPDCRRISDGTIA